MANLFLTTDDTDQQCWQLDIKNEKTGALKCISKLTGIMFPWKYTKKF